MSKSVDTIDNDTRSKLVDTRNNAIIKNVAIYLRKSRAEETEKDLANHLNMLMGVCNKYNLKPVIYKEVKSGATIEMRPEMQRLLIDIKRNMFDAVMVVDIDRLGRGKDSDFEKIKNALLSTKTYLCVVDKLIDLRNENDDMMLDMQFFFARMEYKQITKRLSRGKKLGAEAGYWTNGKPPFPYEYETWGNKYNKRSLVVNDDKLKIYREIIDSVLIYKKPLTHIAYDLNRRGIPSPKGTTWTGVTIGRLLEDETHLGKIVTNKTRGNGHSKNKKPSDAKKFEIIPKEERITADGRHEAVKTQQEHERIIIFLKRDTKAPRRSAVKKILPFTGLIKCAKCGYTLCLQDRKDFPGTLLIKKCWHVDAYGNKCTNRGGPLDIVWNVVNNEISKYEDKILNEINGVDESYVRGIEDSIKEKEALIKTKEKALIRAKEAFEAEAYTIAEFKERKEILGKEIAHAKEDIKILELKLKYADTQVSVERLSIIKEFKEKLTQGELTYEELNNLYKTIIESIVWNRDVDDVKIEVNFL